MFTSKLEPDEPLLFLFGTFTILRVPRVRFLDTVHTLMSEDIIRITHF